jgi:transposase-like protein
VWRHVYRAIDQHGQVIDVLVSARRDADAARGFFRRALSALKVPKWSLTPLRSIPRCSTAHPVGVASPRAVREQSDRG